MRSIVLLPLAALVAVVAGCGFDAREQSLPQAERGAARPVPQRDLTLMTQTPEVRIASPVEMQQLRPQGRTSSPARRPAARESRALEPTVVRAVLVTAAPEPVAQPASTPANDRELLPGRTVTLIPASSGPSSSPDVTDEFPEAHGPTLGVRGGGKCGGRGRGPGIGIATGPRPDFR